MRVDYCDICGMIVKPSKQKKQEEVSYFQEEAQKYEPLLFKGMFELFQEMSNQTSERFCTTCRKQAWQAFVVWVDFRKKEAAKLKLDDLKC
jgi:hypothetical protein